MGNLLKKFGIEPKVIDYGDDTENNKYHETEGEDKLLDSKTNNNKRKNRGK